MSRLAAFLVFLLLVLTFNAYACLLPLQPPSEMNCSSTAEEPSRQTCDAFLEIGLHSEQTSSHTTLLLQVDFDHADQLCDPALAVALPPAPFLSFETPTHFSIQTTVLRI